ncbi:MAG: hypothetical protein ABI587_07870 [Gemmatimonadales bacterium]
MRHERKQQDGRNQDEFTQLEQKRPGVKGTDGGTASDGRPGHVGAVI